ncbi:hypothetical protein PO909_023305 [Leuciscus waleckii]
MSELATLCVPVGVLVEIVGLEWSIAHTPDAEGELHMASGIYNEEMEEVISLCLRWPWLQVSSVSKDPAQAPSPTSSAHNSQFLSPVSTVSLQYLGSSADSTLLRISALGLPVSSSASAQGSPGSTSSCRAHHSTLTPPSFGSTWYHRPYSSTGLPRASGSALVRPRSAYTTDFRVSAYVTDSTPSALSGSTMVLSPIGSVSVLSHPGSTSNARHCSSASVA